MARELGKSRSIVHRRYFLVVLCIIFLTVITLKEEINVNRSSYFLQQLQQQYYTQDVSSRLKSKEDRYNILALLEDGHWEHTYALPNQNDTVQNPLNEKIQKTYLPIEIDWLRGKNLPDKGWRQKFRRNADYDDGLMYQSALGNQFGACLQPDFQPSMSRWVSKNSGHQPQSTSAPADVVSPTLQLILRLAKANATMCLMGDSIDFQFYDALRHNLHRQNQLQSDIKLNITNKHDVPVNYTSETGKPPREDWMTMNHIEETIVMLATDNSTTYYTTTIRYFQMYGWSPWNVPFMEGCTVLVLNLGLHYDARNAGMTGIRWGGPKFEDDFHAAITYMVDFIVSHQGTAVWR